MREGHDESHQVTREFTMMTTKEDRNASMHTKASVQMLNACARTHTHTHTHTPHTTHTTHTHTHTHIHTHTHNLSS